MRERCSKSASKRKEKKLHRNRLARKEAKIEMNELLHRLEGQWEEKGKHRKSPKRRESES